MNVGGQGAAANDDGAAGLGYHVLTRLADRDANLAQIQSFDEAVRAGSNPMYAVISKWRTR